MCRARVALLDVDSNVSVAALARSTGLSRSQFIVRYRAAFGDTPHRTRTRARLERAKRLLATSSLSVTDICMAVGFSSLGSFSHVRAADGGDTELVLESNANPAARTYQQALLEQRIPATAFEVDDVKAELERLRKRGVELTTPPTPAGPATSAVLPDTCGNLLQLYQPPP